MALLDYKTKEKLKKVLARTVLTPDNGNENETMVAFSTARKILSQKGLNFSDLLSQSGASDDSSSHEIETLESQIELLRFHNSMLETELNEIRAKLKASKGEVTAKKDRRVLNKYFAEEAVRQFVRDSRDDYYGWVSTRELYNDFLTEYRDCKALSITKFSLLMQKYLRKITVMGGPKSCSKGFRF